MLRLRVLLATASLVALAAPVAAGAAPSPADHQRSWLHRTLAFQYRLGNSLPLRNTTWIGTRGSLEQRLSLTDQLDLDARSLELELHYVNTPRVGGGKGVVACHDDCATAPLLDDRLIELRRWLDANRTEVVLLLVDDRLGGAEGHEAAARVFAEQLGKRVFAPGGGAGACAPMPLDTTRGALRRTGVRVLVASSCGPDGTAWRDIALDDADLRASQRTGNGFGRYPRCDPDRPASYYDEHVVRAVDGAGAGRLTPAVTREMVGCGVDVFGFDDLRGGDRRLRALAWSWLPDEPRLQAGRTCAVQRADGRWRTEPCGRRHAFACRRDDGGWTVDRRRGAFGQGARRCRGAAAFGLPRSGQEARLLRSAMHRGGVRLAWVRYRR